MHRSFTASLDKRAVTCDLTWRPTCRSYYKSLLRSSACQMSITEIVSDCIQVNSASSKAWQRSCTSSHQPCQATFEASVASLDARMRRQMLTLLERTAGSVLAPAQPRCFAAVRSARPSRVFTLGFHLLCDRMPACSRPILASNINNLFRRPRAHPEGCLWQAADWWISTQPASLLLTGHFGHRHMLPKVEHRVVTCQACANGGPWARR